jgi:hypothetical protein
VVDAAYANAPFLKPEELEVTTDRHIRLSA